MGRSACLLLGVFLFFIADAIMVMVVERDASDEVKYLTTAAMLALTGAMTGYVLYKNGCRYYSPFRGLDDDAYAHEAASLQNRIFGLQHDQENIDPAIIQRFKRRNGS